MDSFSRGIALFSLLLSASWCAALAAQPASGYRLFSGMGQTDTHLLDDTGALVHTWPSVYATSLAVDLAADGSLLRSILISGSTLEHSGLERLAFDGTVLWRVDARRPDLLGHHDIEPLPNGNILRIAYDPMTGQEAIAAGRDPALILADTLVPDKIIEIQPIGPDGGRVVWEWRVRDHLIQDFDPRRANYGKVALHPERIDVNYPPTAATSPDWNHCNAVDYDPENDWIVVSMHTQNEIWIIDHSTTTQQAAGHSGGRWGRGGDLLYRWGNAAAHRRGQPDEQMLFGQHAPTIVPRGYPGAGNIVVFNNNGAATGSAVWELVLPRDASGRPVLGADGRFGPDRPAWSYAAMGFRSQFISSAERLANGNTLVCSGAQGWLFEVDPSGRVVWSHREPPGRFVFHAHHVARSLWSDRAAISAASGGRMRLDLLAGSSEAQRTYLILASAAGTSPGLRLGRLVLPLNADPLLYATAAAPNSAILMGTLGSTGANGGASASVDLGPGTVPAELAGRTVHFAAAVFDVGAAAATATSNPVALALTR